MQTYTVKVDGRTVRVRANSPEEAARKVHEAKAKEPAKKEGNVIADLARAGIGQGLLFNFGDEIEAVARAPFSKRSRKELQADIREQVDNFRGENPALAYGAEFGGALAPAAAALVGTALSGGAAAPAAAATTGRLGLLGAKVAANPLARAVATNAAGGAVSGAGIAEDNKLAGAVGGAALGGLIGGGSRVALPALTKGAKELIDRGVNLTPGQATGGFANQIEQRIGNMAATGGAIMERRGAVNAPIFRETADRALEIVGRKLPSGKLEPLEVLDEVKRGVDAAYDDIANKNPIKGYAGIALLEAAEDAIGTAPDEAIISGVRRALKQATRHLDAPNGKALRDAFDTAAAGNPVRLPAISMSGKEIQTFANAMRKAARTARNGGNHTLSNALEDLQEGLILRGAAKGGVKSEVAAARDAFREYKIMEKAFFSAGNDIDTAPTIAKIAAQRRQNMNTYNRTPNLEARQRADIATRRIVGNTQPNSGTGGQVALQSLPFIGAISPGAAIGAGAMQLAGLPYMNPATTALLRQGILAPGRIGQALGGRFGGHMQTDQ